MQDTIITMFTAFLFGYLLTWLGSTFEKMWRSKSKVACSAIMIDYKSLYIFKKIRLILIIAGAFESTLHNTPGYTALICGLVLYVIGIGLRSAAIFSLQEFWSYHVIRISNHKICKLGIYSVLKHPAYVGNIYILGVLLMMMAPCTAFFSFLFIVVFGSYRISLERKNLLCL